MGLGEYAYEFSALSPVVRAWGLIQKGWNHPLKAFKEVSLKNLAATFFLDRHRCGQNAIYRPPAISPNWNLFRSVQNQLPHAGASDSPPSDFLKDPASFSVSILDP
jgi:hypothetical protein